MKKTPVPSPDGVPRCFGVEFDSKDLGCKRCVVHVQCEPVAVRWGTRRSLTEQVAVLEATITTTRPETLPEIYDRLHREILGKRSRRTLSSRNADVFDRVAAYLLAHSMDAATYIAGNMWAMKPWVENNPDIGFQPSHLQGDNAMRRYHAYLGKQSRRFRQQRHTGETSGTLLADLRQRLYLGEFDVASAYVQAYVADGSADWDAAITEAKPGLDWLAVESQGEGRRAARYSDLSAQCGAFRLRTEKNLTRLQAACAVAQSYEHDLAHRIGARPFTWESFAQLIAYHYPIPLDTVSEDLDGVVGSVWHQ